MKKFTILFLLAAFFASASALRAEDATFKIHGFLDTYFATDNNNIPQSDGFENARIFSGTNSEKNEFCLNIAQVCMYGNYGAARGKMTLHYGDLADNANNGMPFVQQANIGFNVFGNFWVDAGMFLSHIGDESFNPGHNWLSSYSLVTQFQPFFQAGVRFGYETKNLTAQLYVLNAKGTFVENNQNKTYGIYVAYKPIEHLSVSYGNLLGNERAGAPVSGFMEMLHNIQAEYEFSEDFAFKGELDLTSTGQGEGNDDATGMGVSVQAHYKFNPKCSATARFAMLSEKEGDSNEFSGNHITLGAEYNPTPSTYFRLEGSIMSFDDDHKFFRDADGAAAGSRMEVVLNFGAYIK